MLLAYGATVLCEAVRGTETAYGGTACARMGPQVFHSQWQREGGYHARSQYRTLHSTISYLSTAHCIAPYPSLVPRCPVLTWHNVLRDVRY
eukprot:2165707-Rhodomonas_salina.1